MQKIGFATENNQSRKEISFRDSFNPKEAEALSVLTAACNEADKTSYSTPSDADFYYFISDETGAFLAVLCIFHMGDMDNGKAIDELLGLTLPSARQKGYFRALLEAAAPLLRPVQRFAIYRNKAALAALMAIGAVHRSDEHMMALSLNTYLEKQDTETSLKKQEEKTVCTESSKNKDKAGARSAKNQIQETGNQQKMAELKLKLTREADGILADAKEGSCACRFYGSSVYLYGMLIYARYRRQGFGKRFLDALFRKLHAEGKETVLLEVSSENHPAMCLYQTLGFEIQETLSYFYRES